MKSRDSVVRLKRFQVDEKRRQVAQIDGKAGHVLLALHNDRPGIIGAVGTLLGNADVNISFMHVGRRAPRSEAIMALGTDEATTPQLQASISAMPHIQWLKAITL